MSSKECGASRSLWCGFPVKMAACTRDFLCSSEAYSKDLHAANKEFLHKEKFIGGPL